MQYCFSPLFFSSSQKYSNTSKTDFVQLSDQAQVGIETTVYIDKVVTVEEVTTYGIGQVAGNSEVGFCNSYIARTYVLSLVKINLLGVILFYIICIFFSVSSKKPS